MGTSVERAATFSARSALFAAEGKAKATRGQRNCDSAHTRHKTLQGRDVSGAPALVVALPDLRGRVVVEECGEAHRHRPAARNEDARPLGP